MTFSLWRTVFEHRFRHGLSRRAGQRTITQALRTLERDRLLTRTVTATKPVTVTHELTELGRSLQAVIKGLESWAESHMDEVPSARSSYDAQP